MARTVKASPPASNGNPSATEAVRPVTVPDFRAAKQRGQRLVMLTAYDYTMARLLDDAGVDGLLVGDSLGMVVQGQPNSLAVTVDEVVYHSRLVARGIRRCLLVADMPFLSFQVSAEQAVLNAGRLIKEGGAHAVKLEGGVRSRTAIEAITKADIPVMAHVGMTPQSVRRFGGFRVQRDRQRLLDDARAAEEAGAFAMVVECVPVDLANEVTQLVSIPTIGIGAGAGCDGQIMVVHDMLGLFQDLKPRFVKQYADLGTQALNAVRAYCQEVRAGKFPNAEHEFH